MGCKFSKHESRDEDDDLDEQERADHLERELRLKSAKTRCFSCKEVGHKVVVVVVGGGPRGGRRCWMGRAGGGLWIYHDVEGVINDGSPQYVGGG